MTVPRVDDSSIERGDRVAAAQDIDTTQEVHIPAGAKGTVAEDRGSQLVVFFPDQAAVARLDERHLRKVDETSRSSVTPTAQVARTAS
jgi:hypothetical protein